MLFLLTYYFLPLGIAGLQLKGLDCHPVSPCTATREGGYFVKGGDLNSGGSWRALTL
ncbi:hypothetical protein KL86CLO1_11041 [uncultured Eubacteriales bacterium]|uniref:Uncharacterized protein n=1 Tax=uncultured Eubacteriales bacterium TaxID=172733 RepID=A0A212JG85_9FIRM|nr:hypothetical protein KL86CLO1_11041 [uncultured Eubacteriales bacterium]